MALFFFLFLSALSSAVAVDVREMSIDEYINFVNPPAVHKYQNKIGDSMRCVKFSDQISVKYAHDNITRGLKTVPKVKSSTLNISNFNFGGENISMVGLESECPQDTVAIREIKREDVERAGSVRQYLNSRGRRQIIIPNADSVNPVTGSQNEYALVRFNSFADPVRTVSANLNVWNPYVAPSGFFSLSQLWAFNFATDLRVEAIEVGWMVYPRRYGDSKPRLFIYWTNDHYASGCYDLDCAGFVRGGGNVSPGGQLQPISVFDGTQYHILVTLEWQDPGPATGPIWNLFVQNQHVGHFPGILFSRLREGAAKVYIGGEVGYADIAQGTRLSNTEMGSGHFPERGYRRAAYSRITQITGRSGYQVQPYDTFISKHLCYRAIYHGDQRTVFFGGRGQNPKCVAT